MIDPLAERARAWRPTTAMDRNYYPQGNEGYWRFISNHEYGRVGWYQVRRTEWEAVDLDATADAMEILALASRALPYDETPAILNGIGKEIVEHAWNWLERSVRKHLTGGGVGREGRAL